MIRLKLALLVFICQGLAKAFDIGTKYVYDYETSVTSGETHEKPPLGYRMTGELHLLPLWENSEQGKLIEIELKNAMTLAPDGLKNQKKHTTKVLRISPFYVQIAGSKVLKYFSDDDEDIDARNIQKAFASMLQYSIEPHTVIETDQSGVCSVTYAKSGATITKSKRDCAPHARSSSHLKNGIDAVILQNSDTVYDFSSDAFDVIEQISIADTLQMSSSLWISNQISVKAKTDIRLKSKSDENQARIKDDDISGVIAQLETKYKRKLLERALKSEESEDQISNEPDLRKSVVSAKKLLHPDNLSKSKSASVFLNLLKEFRKASKDTIRKVMEDKAFKHILPQIIDIIAFTKTDASVEAAFESLDFIDGDLNLLERYLLSLSLVADPIPLMVHKLLETLETPLKNEKIKASLVSAIGALIRKLEDKEILTKLVKVHFEKKLLACKTENCKLMYLRGFRNAAITSSVDLLKKIAEKGGEPALEALHALRNIGIQQNPKVCEDVAKRVFYELISEQDSSTRIQAADLLSECHPSEGALRDLFSTLADEQENDEFSTAVLSKLKDRMASDDNLKSEIMDLLKTEKRFLFFFDLLQEGSSTSLTDNLMSSSAVNSSYSFFMEMLPGGLLKRSSFDVSLHVLPEDKKLQILSIGMFAGGLNSLAGSSSEEAVKAGMELTFLGVVLRPYVFFEGTSELMGHVWSGTGSQMTPALQGNFLLIDVDEIRVLQNGLTVKTRLNSAASVDLSAAIQISLWNRNSQSEVKNSAALLVMGSLTVGPDPFALEESFAVRGKTSISFLTNLEFYDSPFTSCFRMDHPKLVVWSRRKTSLSIRNTKVFHERRKEKKIHLPSKSFHMHRKNDQLCAIMLRS